MGLPGAPNIGLQLLLTRTDPRRVMLLRDTHALMTQEDRHSLNRHARKQKFNRKRISKAMRVAVWYTSQN
jgi:hypothetical protein